MRRWILAAVLTLCTIPCANAQDRPNIVFVLADDLNARLIPYLPGLQLLLPAQGMTLQMSVPTPVCAPSRASVLTGRYAHNTGVKTNGVWAGGIWAFQAHGNESRTFGVWLQNAGYETGFFGKYINGYGGAEATVPEGWDHWVSYRSYTLSRHDFDTVETGGATRTIHGVYDTDFFAQEVAGFAATATEPFLAVWTPMSPHGPFASAPRHRDLFDGIDLVWPPSFAADPVWVGERTRTRLEMMLSVEEGLEALIATLDARGVLGRTYIFFTSDHGLFMGEHGIPEGKGEPYEETTRVPLYVRGPGVPIGSSDALIVNSDLAPTFAELAGAVVPSDIDGRSFLPLVYGNPLPQERSRVLLEWFEPCGGILWQGLRTPTRKYVEYTDGACRMFRLDRDPYELRNGRCRDSYGRKAALFVDQLADCVGAGCAAVENDCERRLKRCP